MVECSKTFEKNREDVEKRKMGAARAKRGESGRARTRMRRTVKKESETPFVNDLITGDEKWMLYSNHGRKNQWLSKRQVAKPTPKPGLTTKKVLLSVWWDCKGIIHFETLKPGHAINAKVYCEQLDRLAAEIKKNDLLS